MSAPKPLLNFQAKLSADEVVAIASAMHDVAKADGVHPTEEELIGEFLDELGSDLGEEVSLVEMSPRTLAERVADPEVRRLALQCLVLLAMADGKVSPEEAALNRKYAEALGYKREFEGLEAEVISWVKSGDVEQLFG